MSALLFRFREPLSAAGTVVVMLSLFYSWTPTLQPSAKFFAPVELVLSVTEEALPTKQAASHQPEVVPATGGNVPHSLAPAKESTGKAAPTELAGEVATALPGLLPVQGVHAAPVQIIPAPSATTLDSGRLAESVYAAQVRAHLQAVKRYPTGREASLQRPAGTSVIWFVVRRNGELAEAGIDASSGSMLLDNAALATVRRSNYPVFSEEAWPGKAQQRFTVELNFVPAQ